MIITEFNLRRCSLPLRRPLTVGGQTIDRRDCVFLFLTTSEGTVGIGELSPLPGLHEETLDQAAGQLLGLKDHLIGSRLPDVLDFDHLSQYIVPLELYPGCRLAVEMALFDLFIKHNDAADISTLKAISLCGLVAADQNNVLDEVRAIAGKGYKTIKVKIGRQSVDRDIEAIESIRNIVGDKVKLRLDANRMFDFETAFMFCDELGDEGIEYIEEPLVNPDDYPHFCRYCDMPVALDETLIDSQCLSLYESIGVGAFILKPSVLGGFRRTADMVNIAKKKKIMPVMSCAFQSGYTLSMFAVFAAYLGLADVAIGLDTLKWFEYDILREAMPVAEGRIDIQGILMRPPELNEELLKKYER
ncbi:MAG: o-succinylbenzoate synthase [Anaerohalosphaera sp.]|nr:o-succinylbenzoate synthase [Anaerohalosphaera sp.]